MFGGKRDDQSASVDGRTDDLLCWGESTEYTISPCARLASAETEPEQAVTARGDARTREAEDELVAVASVR
jgi:hypothetical protein